MPLANHSYEAYLFSSVFALRNGLLEVSICRLRPTHLVQNFSLALLANGIPSSLDRFLLPHLVVHAFDVVLESPWPLLAEKILGL